MLGGAFFAFGAEVKVRVCLAVLLFFFLGARIVSRESEKGAYYYYFLVFPLFSPLSPFTCFTKVLSWDFGEGGEFGRKNIISSALLRQSVRQFFQEYCRATAAVLEVL